MDNQNIMHIFVYGLDIEEQYLMEDLHSHSGHTALTMDIHHNLSSLFFLVLWYSIKPDLSCMGCVRCITNCWVSTWLEPWLRTESKVYIGKILWTSPAIYAMYDHVHSVMYTMVVCQDSHFRVRNPQNNNKALFQWRKIQECNQHDSPRETGTVVSGW